MVVDKPQSTRVKEPTLLWNQVKYYFISGNAQPGTWASNADLEKAAATKPKKGAGEIASPLLLRDRYRSL
jgi:hypothetical protein